MTKPIEIYRHRNSALYGVRWDGRDTRVDLDGPDPIKLAERAASAIRGALDAKKAVVEFVVADTGRRVRVTVFAPEFEDVKEDTPQTRLSRASITVSRAAKAYQAAQDEYRKVYEEVTGSKYEPAIFRANE